MPESEIHREKHKLWGVPIYQRAVLDRSLRFMDFYDTALREKATRDEHWAHWQKTYARCVRWMNSGTVLLIDLVNLSTETGIPRCLLPTRVEVPERLGRGLEKERTTLTAGYPAPNKTRTAL
jgi:hypothetical protein